MVCVWSSATMHGVRPVDDGARARFARAPSRTDSDGNSIAIVYRLQTWAREPSVGPSKS